MPRYRQARPNVPSRILQEVRQRCGFGCVVCGRPIYDVDHIDNWADVGVHNPDRMTLLCSNHHADKTRGRLSVRQVEQFNENPYNIVKGVIAPYNFLFEQGMPMVECAGNIFQLPDNGSNLLIPVLMHGVPVVAFSLDGGALMLSATFFRDDGSPALIIRNNILYLSALNWDIEVVGTRFIIRLARRKILLEIDITPEGVVRIPRGRFSVGGTRVTLGPEGFSTGGLIMRGNLIMSQLGVAIGDNLGIPCAVHVVAPAPVVPIPDVPLIQAV